MNGIVEDQSMELSSSHTCYVAGTQNLLLKKTFFYSAFAALMVIEEIGFLHHALSP